MSQSRSHCMGPIYKKKLSIIVPCYKVEKYLPKCLDSLVNQTLDGIEIICINDGSPDSCKDIIKRYAIKYTDMVILIDKKNEGVWRGRQDGIRAARGEYIGFVDSDDTVSQDFAMSLYNAAKDTNADIAVGGFQRIDLETGKVLSKEMCSFRSAFNIADDPGRILELNGAPWNKVFRASVLKNMYDLSCPPPVLDDLIFHLMVYLQLKNKGKVVFVPKPLVHYMVRSNSIINSVRISQIEKVYKAFLEVKHYYKQENASIQLMHVLDAEAFIHLGVSLLFRLSKNKDINMHEQIASCTEFLDKNFSSWRNSEYFTKKYVNSHGGLFRRMQIAHSIYLAGLMPSFLRIYDWSILTFKHDIKW